VANSLGKDLTDRYVVLREDVMSPGYRDIAQRVFKVEGGFGAVGFTRGTALIGTTPVDGEHFRMEGYDVERYATDEEIALVTGKPPVAES